MLQPQLINFASKHTDSYLGVERLHFELKEVKAYLERLSSEIPNFKLNPKLTGSTNEKKLAYRFSSEQLFVKLDTILDSRDTLQTDRTLAISALQFIATEYPHTKYNTYFDLSVNLKALQILKKYSKSSFVEALREVVLTPDDKLHQPLAKMLKEELLWEQFVTDNLTTGSIGITKFLANTLSSEGIQSSEKLLSLFRGCRKPSSKAYVAEKILEFNNDDLNSNIIKTVEDLESYTEELTPILGKIKSHDSSKLLIRQLEGGKRTTEERLDIINAIKEQACENAISILYFLKENSPSDKIKIACSIAIQAIQARYNNHEIVVKRQEYPDLMCHDLPSRDKTSETVAFKQAVLNLAIRFKKLFDEFEFAFESDKTEKELDDYKLLLEMINIDQHSIPYEQEVFNGDLNQQIGNYHGIVPYRGMCENRYESEAFKRAYEFCNKLYLKNNLGTIPEGIIPYGVNVNIINAHANAWAETRTIQYREDYLRLISSPVGLEYIFSHEIGHASAKVVIGKDEQGFIYILRKGCLFYNKNLGYLGRSIDEYASESLARLNYLTNRPDTKEENASTWNHNLTFCLNEDYTDQVMSLPHNFDKRLFLILRQSEEKRILKSSDKERKTPYNFTFSACENYFYLEPNRLTGHRSKSSYSYLMGCFDQLAKEIYPKLSREKAKTMFRHQAIYAQKKGDISFLVKLLKEKFGDSGCVFLLQIDPSVIYPDVFFLNAFVKAGKLDLNSKVILRNEIIELFNEFNRERTIKENSDYQAKKLERLLRFSGEN